MEMREEVKEWSMSTRILHERRCREVSLVAGGRGEETGGEESALVLGIDEDAEVGFENARQGRFRFRGGPAVADLRESEDGLKLPERERSATGKRRWRGKDIPRASTSLPFPVQTRP